jgi:hypothetical protein
VVTSRPWSHHWIADDVQAAGGSCTVWLSAPATQAQERELATAMRAARAAEYRTVTAEAESAVTAPAAERAKGMTRPGVPIEAALLLGRGE